MAKLIFFHFGHNWYFLYTYGQNENHMLIGREEEIALFNKKLESNKSEFIVLYGRRRVGKTFLVRTLFDGNFTFRLTGINHVTLKDQLANFDTAMDEQHPNKSRNKTETWMDAFQQIKEVIKNSKKQKKIIFIDELPWFDTPHSKFIPALEHFWNSWASARKDVLLVTCGSAASWMLNKLINNKGGLHNRVTQKIKIEPFSLKECKDLLESRKINLDNYQILQLYMTLGGIPFYWDAIEKGLSASQNINNLCFEKNGLLRTEFANLFKSLFDDAERHEAIVAALAKKSKGLTRDEIQKESKLPTGGSLSRLLDELEESGFIRKYQAFGKKQRNSLYQLSDFFSLFHIRFIKGQKVFDKNYWLKMIDSPKQRTWSGYAFEQLCLSHVPQLKKALGISGIETETSSWKSIKSSNGAQIDLVIDRRDGIINLCEMKFSQNKFTIDKKYDQELRNKLSTFKSETGTNKSLFLTMVTTFGLEQNLYSGNIQNEIKADALFS